MAGSPKPVDLELTIISARDLKNVNWRYGDLRPYAVAWVDPAYKVSTKVDLEGDTNPSWNEKLIIPVTKPLQDAELTIDIVHEKAAELTKPLIGTARIALTEILDEVGFDERQERTLKLKRPSGRPQGKLDIGIRLREKRWPEQQYGYPQPYGTRDYPPQGYTPNYAPYPSQQYPYANIPPPSGYPNPYGSPYPQPRPGPYGGPSYYEQGPSGYGSTPPPPVYGQGPSGYGSASYGQGPSGYGSASYGQGPSGYGSASAPPVYGQPENPKSSKFGLGTGLAVGAVAGVLGGLALEEGVDYVEDKIADEAAERVEDDLGAAGGFDDYDGGDDF